MTFEQDFMRMLADQAALNYKCNRPPGPAGAAICINTHRCTQAIYGFVEPIPGHGLYSCIDAGCEMENGHCIRNIHAEQRAIINAAKMVGISTVDASIYSVLKPCYSCTKHIIAAGITQIYYAGVAYDEPRTQNILHAAYMKCHYIDIGLPYAQELVKK